MNRVFIQCNFGSDFYVKGDLFVVLNHMFYELFFFFWFVCSNRFSVDSLGILFATVSLINSVTFEHNSSI